MKSKLTTFLIFLIYSPILFGQTNTYVKPKIYAVIVGISNYKDSNIPNLKFPEKDALAYYDFLRSPNSGSVPEENIALLTGSKATMSNILKEVVDKFSRSNKEDMIIFYFSGHGKAGYDASGYLLTYDTDYENDLGTAISMPNLKEKFDGFQAKIKVSYLDACHAGLFSSNGKGLLEDDNAIIARTFLDILSKSGKGSVRFLASSATQQSLEDDQFGHGVFTYFLIKGLRGEADLSQYETNTYNDGIVNISELKTYLSDSISRHTKFKQTPSVEGLYYDQFPLSILRANISFTTIISKTQGYLETKQGIQNTPTDFPTDPNETNIKKPKNPNFQEIKEGVNNSEKIDFAVIATTNGKKDNQLAGFFVDWLKNYGTGSSSILQKPFIDQGYFDKIMDDNSLAIKNANISQLAKHVCLVRYKYHFTKSEYDEKLTVANCTYEIMIVETSSGRIIDNFKQPEKFSDISEEKAKQRAEDDFLRYLNKRKLSL